MTNEEKAQNIANSQKMRGYSVDDIYACVFHGCLEMVEWKEQQMIEKAVNRGYLTDWYQSSVDETQQPIWTDKHLDELYKDFYLIPKNDKL